MSCIAFDGGQIVATAGVAHDSKVEAFSKFVTKCLLRHFGADWGDVCEDDAKSNDYALTHGERLLSAYEIDTEQFDVDENRLWIITEADRSVTTVLYPDEY